MAPGGLDIVQAKQSLEGRIKTLINADLKEICRKEGLAVSGVKAQLQKRILEYIDAVVQQGDMDVFNRVRYRAGAHGSSPPADAAFQQDHSMHISPTPNRQMAAAYGRPHLPQYQNSRPFGTPARLSFRPSPFYHIEDALIPIQDLPEMPSNRHTVTASIQLSDAVCDRLRADSRIRAMLYCSSSSLGSLGISTFSLSDIAFPNQLEVRVNGEEIKSNFKGLKNKPGSTKPADLTEFIRKLPKYNNVLNVTYALTSKKYSFVVNLVRKSSADELTDRIKTGKVITKEDVVREMVKQASDPDIVTTSSVMSLKDPISTMRMNLPCRSTLCTHNQCFDASYFLQLQEQAPTWICPVCNKTLTYEVLAIDQYVQNILQATSKGTEQVTIEPNGEWRNVVQDDGQANGGKNKSRASYDKDSDDELFDDDDVVEIQETKPKKVKSEAMSATPAFLQRTPPLSSREASTSATSGARASHNANNKRVEIDLTLSDDDEPPRPAKRNYTSQTTSYNTPASLPDVRSADIGYRPPPSGLGLGNIHSRPDTLAPFLPGPSTGAPNNGQRLPWTFDPSAVFTTWRDPSGSHSHSP